MTHLWGKLNISRVMIRFVSITIELIFEEHLKRIKTSSINILEVIAQLTQGA